MGNAQKWKNKNKIKNKIKPINNKIEEDDWR
jgi:hypothetical protein